MNVFFFYTSNVLASELDKLFGGLKNAENIVISKQYESKIWKYWSLGGSNETNNQQMAIGISLVEQGKLNEALTLFINLSKLEPNWAEPINKIATIRFLQGDFPGSIRYIKFTLKLEPRHFGAISGLAQINLSLKNYRGALKNIDYAIGIHPYIGVKNLRPIVLNLLYKTNV